MFSLARALFSPGSAEDRSSLFAWFIDSMARSDSSEACASAVWLYAFADRPRPPFGARRSRGLPVLVHVVSQRARVLRLRTARSRLSRNSRVAFLQSGESRRPGLRFSKLNSPAHRCPCLRFGRHLAMSPARLRAKMESLSPFLWDSFIPCNMPVYPGAPSLTRLPEKNYLREASGTCPVSRLTSWGSDC